MNLKSFTKLIVLMAVFLIGSRFALAQNNYQLSALNGTFTPLTGGIPVTAIQADNVTSNPIDIGFTFNFNGINYTQLVASSNGILRFKTTSFYDTWNNLKSSSARPLIAPLWDDLSGVGGSASYLAEGTAPNRIFTFEWLNWKWGSSASTAGISFQAKLYETSNRIEFVYRQEAGTLNSSWASIGLAFQDPEIFASLNNSTSAPTLSSTTENFEIATKPATGQIYRFDYVTYPEPSNQATAFTAINNDKGNITLTWTDATGAQAPGGYIIMANTTNNFTDPKDGTDIIYDNYLGDGAGTIKIAQGFQTFSDWLNRKSNTTYYFKIYSYTNNGSVINYKTDGTIPKIQISPLNEPSEHVTNFTSTNNNGNIVLNWTDAAGAQPPTGYVILASKTNSFTEPVDGSVIYSDNDLTDGKGTAIVFQGTQTYSLWVNPEGSNDYYFRIYPFTNNQEAINYKTNGIIPQTQLLFIKPEPNYHATGFTATDNFGNIKLTWSDSYGTIKPDGYLILANTTGNFSDPADGTEINTDNDLMDGNGAVKVPWANPVYSSWINFNIGTNYYFRIYPYTNKGTAINYKTTVTVPQTSIVLTAKAEPTNHVTNFAATETLGNITLTWTDATGAQLPEGYQILVSKTGTFPTLTDGTTIPNDNNLADGVAAVKILPGVQTYKSFINNDVNTTYYFRIYPFTNPYALNVVNYKTDGTVPQIQLSVANYPFVEQNSISFIGVDNSYAAWGDYNNDGFLDVLLTGSLLSKIYKNNGDNTFTEQTGISLFGVRNGAGAWGDYDNDGDLDIIITGSGISKIYKNNGNNTFTEQTEILLTGFGASTVAWGDYDNDGFLDIVIGGDNGESKISKIYKNNKDNTFIEQVGITLPGINYGSAAWGDYDNDGDLDILLAGASGSLVYKNIDNNSFTAEKGISLFGVDFANAAWGDYDNDGDQDILVSGYNNASNVLANVSKIFKNNGDSTFTEQTNISLTGVSRGSSAWGDYDNDGDLDILLTGYTGSSYISKVYKNNGDNTFSELTGNLLPGVYWCSAVWGDYDNDGDLDIFLSGNTGSTSISKIYKNTTTNTNTKPTVPTNLNSAISGRKMNLKWDKSTDDKIPQNALSYNIYISTVSNKENIKGVMSNLSNGYRRITQIGNAGQKNSYTIKDLIGGQTYYWNVQAIDNNYNGSAFATEQSFFMPLERPIIQSSKIQVKSNTDLSVSLSWIGGSGSRRLVFVKQDNNTVGIPADNVTYIADNRFGKGSQIESTGWYCVYSGNGNSVEIKDLVPNAKYYAVIFDYDGSNGAELYNKTITTDNSTSFTGLIFQSQTTILKEIERSDIQWGDYDNDGDLDVLAVGKDKSFVYKNNGDNSFTKQSQLIGSNLNGKGVWIDYNNDNYLDILIGGYTSTGGIAKIFKNNGDNSFSEQYNIIDSTMRVANFDCGDYNNDKYIDILIYGKLNTKDTLMLYTNNKNNSFSVYPNLNLPNLFLPVLKWFDFDNDGDLDFIYCGWDGKKSVSNIVENDKGTFKILNGLNLDGFAGGAAASGDIDADGDLDFILSGGYMFLTAQGDRFLWPQPSILYINNNDRTFSKHSFKFGESILSTNNMIDYDNDGDLDISVFDNSRAYIYENIENKNFVLSNNSNILTGRYLEKSSWGDFDNDGDLDLLRNGEYGSAVLSQNQIVKNKVATTVNNAPSAPANLKVAIIKRDEGKYSLRIDWDKASDAETPQNGLNYNIFIGTQPDLYNIASPAANINGFQKIIQLGNVQKNNFYTINNVDFANTFFIGVQTVDNGYKGSVPATTQLYEYACFALPGTVQLLEKGKDGSLLTIKEFPAATSREWKYSTTPGSGYKSFTTPVTGASYLPNFSEYGTYYVICESDFNGKKVISNEVKIVIKNNQTITFNAIPEKRTTDAPFILNATSSSGLAVTYTSSNTAVATISGSTVTIVGAGTTDITASQSGNENYHPAPEVKQTLTVVTSTAIEDVVNNLFTIWPNPTQSVITITSPEIVKYIEIMDISGKLLKSQTVNNLTTDVTIGNLPNGIYLIKIYTNTKIAVKRVVKE